MLQALVERGTVTLLAWERPDFRSIDDYYGTDLHRRSIPVITVLPDRLVKTVCALGIPHELFKISALMNFAKRHRRRFRHCLSAFNELDLGGGAVQYIHYPYQDFRRLASRPAPFWSPFPLYFRACQALSGWSVEGIRSNYTLANSQWSAAQYQQRYECPVSAVLYPPPLGRSETPRQGERRPAFLSIGRVIPIKDWFKVIDIIEGVRARGHDVALTLAGSREDSRLLAGLQERASRCRPWLSLVLDPARAHLDRLISEHRYGLHGMVNEHYGMAVAELVLGGCLTFVHDSGGQVEIVAQPEARYTTVEDAVEKICAVLACGKRQAALLDQQAEGRERMTRETFLRDLHAFLDQLESAPV
jgi:glycosyltransferase involved in cell wall biosynthesis